MEKRVKESIEEKTSKFKDERWGDKEIISWSIAMAGISANLTPILIFNSRYEIADQIKNCVEYYLPNIVQYF